MSSHRPNTLLISPHFDAGLPNGGSQHSIDTAREWLRRGRQLHVLCLNRRRTLADLEARVNTGQLVLHPIADEKCARFTHHPNQHLYTSARALIARIQPDLIHVHNTQGMMSAIAAAVESASPTILTALDFGLLCLNSCLYTQSPNICKTPMSAQHCADCIARTLHGPARVLGRLLPRCATRQIWPRSVHLDQMKSVGELHRLMRYILRSLRAIIAPSPGLAEILMSQGVTRRRVHHLLHGISLEKIVRPAKTLCGSLRFGYVGGTHPIKGFATIADALNLLPSHLPLRIRAFGGENLRTWIAAQSAQVQSYVEYHPPLFCRDLMVEHARLDAMIVPSIGHDNSPFAAIEALANGTPVLGSNHPGISHLIVANHNGWLIQPGNPAAWAKALIRAIQQPAKIRAMQLNSTFTRTAQDFVDDLEWIETPLWRRNCQPESFQPNPPVAVYT